MAWNDADQVRCELSLVCARGWDELETTGDPNQRHCDQCDRRVHLASSPAEFAAIRQAGGCVAVMLSADSVELPEPGPPVMLGVPRPDDLTPPNRLVPIAVLVAVAVGAAALIWWWI